MTTRQFFHVVELRTKVVSLSALLVGTLSAILFEGAFAWYEACLLWTAALAVDMGTTAFNSYFDYRSRTDDKTWNREADKVLVHEGVPPGEALISGLVLYLLAGVFGLALSLVAGFGVALFGTLSMVVGFLYTGGPRPISRGPLGELFAGAFLGFGLTMLSYYAFTRRLDARAAQVALPSFFMVASILAVNNACDLEGDKAAGRRTLAIRLGPVLASRLPPLLAILGWLAAAYCVLHGLLPLLSALPLAVGFLASLPLWQAMRARGYSHAAKGADMRSVSLAFLVHSLSLVGALLLALAAGRG